MTTEMPVAFYERTQHAKREYACSECGDIIKQGSKYRYAYGCWPGRPKPWMELRHCLRCADWFDAGLRHAAFPEEAPAYGELREYWLEYGFDIEQHLPPE